MSKLLLVNLYASDFIQSFHTPSLRAVDRPSISPEKLHKFMGEALQANMLLKVDIILGVPYETVDSYFEGLASFLPHLVGTDLVLNIHRSQILPGSDLATKTAEFGIEYIEQAPHLALCTGTIDRRKMRHASREAVLAEPAHRESRLAKMVEVDDTCWNGDVYREIQSVWLSEQLEMIMKQDSTEASDG